MPATLLLILIYFAFISLGLPDSMFGSSWTIMRETLGVSTEMAGVHSMIVAVGTVVSALSADRMIRRFGTGKIVLVSVFLTAGALLCYSFTGVFWVMCLFAIPLGLGAGCIDAALNNYVAVHYSARHMSWLHCMWGVGVTASPLIASFWLARNNWQGGYTTVAVIQFVLVVLLAVGMPLWSRVGTRGELQSSDDDGGEHIGNLKALKIPGVKWALLTFFCYCAAEAIPGLWGATFLADHKGLPVETAALGISLYYAGITGGRFINGFLAAKLKSRTLILGGSLIALFGAVLAALLPGLWSAGGLLLCGLGFAPVYPSTIHETPARFGRSSSQAVTGLQMAFAYIGVVTMPPLFGLISGYAGIQTMPWAVAIFTAGVVLGTVMIERRRKSA